MARGLAQEPVLELEPVLEASVMARGLAQEPVLVPGSVVEPEPELARTAPVPGPSPHYPHHRHSKRQEKAAKEKPVTGKSATLSSKPSGYS